MRMTRRPKRLFCHDELRYRSLSAASSLAFDQSREGRIVRAGTHHVTCRHRSSSSRWCCRPRSSYRVLCRTKTIRPRNCCDSCGCRNQSRHHAATASDPGPPSIGVSLVSEGCRPPSSDSPRSPRELWPLRCASLSAIICRGEPPLFWISFHSFFVVIIIATWTSSVSLDERRGTGAVSGRPSSTGGGEDTSGAVSGRLSSIGRGGGAFFSGSGGGGSSTTGSGAGGSGCKNTSADQNEILYFHKKVRRHTNKEDVQKSLPQALAAAPPPLDPQQPALAPAAIAPCSPQRSP